MLLPRRRSLKFLLLVPACWFLFTILIIINDKVRLNGQLNIQPNQLNNEQLENVKSERLVKSEADQDVAASKSANNEKVINQSNDKPDNGDQTNLVSVCVLFFFKNACILHRV